MWQRIKKFGTIWQERRIAKLIQQTDGKKLYPECLWVVCFDDEKISCTDEDGQTTCVPWNELSRVSIATNDTGPLGCDLYWCLFTNQDNPAIMVPDGATGLESLRDRLMAMPGFDHEKMIEACSSVDNAQFLCWEKQDA